MNTSLSRCCRWEQHAGGARLDTTGEKHPTIMDTRLRGTSDLEHRVQGFIDTAHKHAHTLIVGVISAQLTNRSHILVQTATVRRAIAAVAATVSANHIDITSLLDHDLTRRSSVVLWAIPQPLDYEDLHRLAARTVVLPTRLRDNARLVAGRPPRGTTIPTDIRALPVEDASLCAQVICQASHALTPAAVAVSSSKSSRVSW